MAARMKAVFAVLRDENDLALVPWIIRSQAARHGLGAVRPQQDEPHFLSEDETKEAVNTEVEKWKEWLFSGRWLMPPLLSGPLRGLIQLSPDPDTVKAEIARQLKDNGSVIAFAKLLRSVALERSDLKKLVHPDRVLELVESALPGASEEDRERLERLAAVARGEDL